MFSRPVIVLALALTMAGAPAQQCGDCNLDGVVNIIDALAASQHAVGTSPLPMSALPFCDVDSITNGVALAQSGGLTRVIVDRGVYNEALTLADGIMLRGGYDSAAFWTYTATGVST